MISPFNISNDSFLHLEGSSTTDFDAPIGLLISKICQKFLSILKHFFSTITSHQGPNRKFFNFRKALKLKNHYFRSFNGILESNGNSNGIDFRGIPTQFSPKLLTGFDWLKFQSTAGYLQTITWYSNIPFFFFMHGNPGWSECRKLKSMEMPDNRSFSLQKYRFEFFNQSLSASSHLQKLTWLWKTRFATGLKNVTVQQG